MGRRTLEEALREGRQYLKKQGIIEYELDGWYLFSFHFQMNRASYLLNLSLRIEEEDFISYMELIKRRGEKIPLQYITGNQEFMGLTFLVSEDVLIPRQDTEILVEEVLKISSGKDVLDVCTGSGCIILSLSKLGNIAKGMGVDISKKALMIANKNKENLKAEVTFLESDLFKEVEGQYDIIVSNPPYIKTEDIKGLMEEVKVHEPYLALDGKEDGLYFYKKIIEQLPAHLKSGGSIFFEIGYNQGEEVSALLRKAGFQSIEVIKDLAKLDRVVKGVYGKS